MEADGETHSSYTLCPVRSGRPDRSWNACRACARAGFDGRWNLVTWRFRNPTFRRVTDRIHVVETIMIEAKTLVIFALLISLGGCDGHLVTLNIKQQQAA